MLGVVQVFGDCRTSDSASAVDGGGGGDVSIACLLGPGFRIFPPPLPVPLLRLIGPITLSVSVSDFISGSL